MPIQSNSQVTVLLRITWVFGLLLVLYFGFVAQVNSTLPSGVTLECGSAWLSDESKLGSLGVEVCEQVGLGRNRTISFVGAAVGAASALGIAMARRTRTCEKCGQIYYPKRVTHHCSHAFPSAPAMATVVIPTGTSIPSSAADALTELNRLLEQGLISAEEHAAKRTEILKRI